MNDASSSVRKVQAVGHQLVVSIPRQLARALHLKRGDYVVVQQESRIGFEVTVLGSDFRSLRALRARAARQDSPPVASAPR